jgi:amino acid transporter
MRGTDEQVQRNGKPSDGRLGTFAGVFTPSILTIFGIILFLRMGYVVGSSGLARALEIILLANLISVLTTFSVSAIATNFRVKGGGDYYLISRTLGLGFGGAIGIVLFLAQSVSIGFYCIGFGEAMAALAAGSHPVVAQMIAGIAVAALFWLAWQGADLATRFQYVVMALLVVALASFAAGALNRWDQDLLQASLVAPAQPAPFWLMFAIFFPAVTGFTQGVSMSGDLRDAGKSIPLGTFLAVGLSIVVYVGVAILLAASAGLSDLEKDFGTMRRVSAAGWLIDVGVVAATLSSALASFLGAPRILQSLAADRIFPLLTPFARGFGPGLNPRRGVVLSGAIAFAVVALGDLNAIAPVVSMFFLVSYGLVNYATWYEATAASPSFRPTFRWYHRHVSLAGVVACAGVALAIDAWAALIALAILFGVFQYLRLRGTPSRWADSRRSFYLKQVREGLIAAAREPEHPRDWRPNVLAFSDSPERRGRLVKFASWIEGGSGLTTVVRVLEGEGVQMLKRREEALEALTGELKAMESNAFPLVIAAPSFEAALSVLVQSVGVGPARINTVLANWFDGPPGLVDEWASSRFGTRLRTAFRLGSNLLILDAGSQEWAVLDRLPSRKRVIDVWWRADRTGQMMVLLAYLMTRSEDWADARIRVLVAAAQDAADAHLDEVSELLAAARIEAEAVVIDRTGSDAFVEQSAQASLVFLGIAIREGRILDAWERDVSEILPRLPLTVMAMAAQDVDLDTHPDEGDAAQAAALLDRLADASRKAAKAQQAAADAGRRADKARAALGAAVAGGDRNADLGKLTEEVEAAQAEAEEAVRDALAAAGRKQALERSARELGVLEDDDGKT